MVGFWAVALPWDSSAVASADKSWFSVQGSGAGLVSLSGSGACTWPGDASSGKCCCFSDGFWLPTAWSSWVSSNKSPSIRVSWDQAPIDTLIIQTLSQEFSSILLQGYVDM